MRIKDIPESRIKEVLNRAEEVRASANKLNPFTIAKQYKIECRFVNRNRLYAYKFRDNVAHTWVIHIHKRFNADASYFLCYHELGHIFTNNPKDDAVSEFCANLFASCFMPSFTIPVTDETTVDEFNNFVSTLFKKKNFFTVHYYRHGTHIKKIHGKVYYTRKSIKKCLVA